MNLNLHPSLAILLSCCVLALGLFATGPGARSVTGVPAIQEPAIAARVQAVAGHLDPRLSVASAEDTLAAATPAVRKSRHASGKSRRIRQSMAMPFFSFAPRG
jgi:hypothetical protein